MHPFSMHMSRAKLDVDERLECKTELQRVRKSISRISMTEFAQDALKQFLVGHVAFNPFGDVVAPLNFNIAYCCKAYL